MTTFEKFLDMDIRAGEIIQCEVFVNARKPAYKLLIDFGEEIGIKRSSAQITELYNTHELIGKQILGIVNLSPMKIADFISEVLVLGVYSSKGVVLIVPEQKVLNGDKLG